jgi:hypothetical protein
VTYGIGHAIRIDIVALLACSIGVVKRAVLGRTHTATPHFVRDLIRHSVIWPQNRKFPSVRWRSAS